MVFLLLDDPRHGLDVGGRRDDNLVREIARRKRADVGGEVDRQPLGELGKRSRVVAVGRVGEVLGVGLDLGEPVLKGKDRGGSLLGECPGRRRLAVLLATVIRRRRRVPGPLPLDLRIASVAGEGFATVRELEDLLEDVGEDLLVSLRDLGLRVVFLEERGRGSRTVRQGLWRSTSPTSRTLDGRPRPSCESQRIWRWGSMATSPSCASVVKQASGRRSAAGHPQAQASRNTHEIKREEGVDADRVHERKGVRQLLAEAGALAAVDLGVGVLGVDELFKGLGRHRRTVSAEGGEGSLDTLDGSSSGGLEGGGHVVASLGLLLGRRVVGREQSLDVLEKRDERLRTERIEVRDVHAGAELSLELDEVVAAGHILRTRVLGQVGQGCREDVLEDALPDKQGRSMLASNRS